MYFDLLLDVKTKEKWENKHLKGTTLVETPLPPLTSYNISNLKEKLKILTFNLNKNSKIGVYCKKGIRSFIATQILKNLGFMGIINLGGVETLPLINLSPSYWCYLQNKRSNGSRN